MTLIVTITMLLLWVVHRLGTYCYGDWKPLTSVALIVSLASLPLLAGYAG